MSKKPITLESLPALRNGRAKILLNYIEQENGFILEKDVFDHFKTLGLTRADVDRAINDLCEAEICRVTPTDEGISVDLITSLDEPEEKSK